MKFTPTSLLLTLALTASSAPITNEKRQFSLPSGTGGFGGLSTGLPSTGTGSTGGLGGLGGTGGLGGLGGSSSGTGGLGGLGSLGGLTGSTGSSSGGLGGLGGGASSLGGLSSLGRLPGSGSGLAGLRGRQFDLGSLMGGSSGSGTSGLGGLTGSTGTGSTGTSGFGNLGSLGGLSGTGSSAGTSTGSTGASSGSGGSNSGTSSSSGDGSCKSVTLLFARGTGEIGGTLGTVIGSPLADALASQLGADKVGSEGVDYPADAAGNANLGASGGPQMASQAQAILSSCPDTKLVLGGYSQGAMVVHNALSAQGLDGSKVAAAVLFGDPFNGQALDGVDASKVKEFCGGADTLCAAGGSTGSGSHLSYGGDADAAAQFIVSAIGA